MNRIEAGTDVNSEMLEVLRSFEDCATCTKVGIAAIEMMVVRYSLNSMVVLLWVDE